MKHWSEKAAPKHCYSMELRTGQGIHMELRIADFILTTLGGPKVLHVVGVTLSGAFHIGPFFVHMEHTLEEGTEKGKPGRCCLAIIQVRDGIGSDLSSARKAHPITLDHLAFPFSAFPLPQGCVPAPRRAYYSARGGHEVSLT